MMELQHNISLKPYNTFGINVDAAGFAVISQLAHLPEIATLPQPLHILGGGSNVLLTGNVEGTVLHNQLQGITITKEDQDHVWLEVLSGEVWHNLVLHAINNGWGGIENLALIPGTVGAAPIQNIGAYGVEACNTIESVTCWHLLQQSFITLTNAHCLFGYRESIFKHTLAGQVFITSVCFKLTKKPVYNTHYGAIEQELAAMGIKDLSVKAIADAVIHIRKSKLPDPQVIGNAGSFFKNPTISLTQYHQLAEIHPGMPHFPVSAETVKIPAAWLIEQCGWKGYKRGDFGVHTRQALVLVNYGNATGKLLWELSGEILDSVKNQFEIQLEREVQVW